MTILARPRLTALLVLSLAAVMALAVACGDDGDADADEAVETATSTATATAAATETATATEAATETATPEATTRVIEDTVGEVEIPVSPQRIITFGPFASALLALEAPVVGIAELNASTLVPEIAERYEGLTIIGQRAEIDLEAVAALDPDLIISTIPAGGAFDTSVMEEIAPVLVFAPEDPAEWASMAERIADAVGKTDVYEAQKAAYEARAEEIATEYADVLESVTFAGAGTTTDSETWRRNFALGYMTNALVPAGARIPGEPSSGEEAGFEDLSFERLVDLNEVDAILIDGGTDGQPSATAQVLIDQAIWATLEPVQAGMAFPLAWSTPRDYPTAMHTLDAFEGILEQIREMQAG